MEHPLEETIRLLDLTDDRLGVLVASNEIEPSVKSALGELASRRQALGRQNAELEKLKEQRRQLVEDEQRLRDNLAAVGARYGAVQANARQARRNRSLDHHPVHPHRHSCRRG